MLSEHRPPCSSRQCPVLVDGDLGPVPVVNVPVYLRVVPLQLDELASLVVNHPDLAPTL